jgi:hypothetical protein
MDGVDKHPKRKVAAGPPPPTYKGKNYRWLTIYLPPTTTLKKFKLYWKSANNVHYYSAEWITSEAQQILISPPPAKAEGDYSFRFRLSVCHIKILSCPDFFFYVLWYLVCGYI